DDWTRSAVAAACDPAMTLAAALKGEAPPLLLPLLTALAKRAADAQNAAAFVPLLSAAVAAPARADAVKAVILEAAAALKSAPPDSEALQATLKTLLASDNLRISAG